MVFGKENKNNKSYNIVKRLLKGEKKVNGAFFKKSLKNINLTENLLMPGSHLWIRLLRTLHKFLKRDVVEILAIIFFTTGWGNFFYNYRWYWCKFLENWFKRMKTLPLDLHCRSFTILKKFHLLHEIFEFSSVTVTVLIIKISWTVFFTVSHRFSPFINIS